MEEPEYQSLPKGLEEKINFISGILPIELVPCRGDRITAPTSFADRIMIYSIHGGDVIPECYYNAVKENYPNEIKLRETLLQRYSVEKDWGANQTALELAEALGLPGYWRVNIARVLMDFGRFPGITPAGAGHMDRYAINYPFSNYLGFDEKRALLEQCFDYISDVFEEHMPGKILTIGVHSYDARNPTLHYLERGTVRPDVSVIFRSEGVQKFKHMPRGMFDGLYPDKLAESTIDRKLASRISLTLEKADVNVSHNYPYYLPDGSMEVRSQVWTFFTFLRDAFEAIYPDTKEDPAYRAVWEMMLDTNLRHSRSDALRGYLHMFRRPPRGNIVLFKKARLAYEHLCRFFDSRHAEILTRYRYAPNRLGTLAIEVRKDLVWRFHDHHTWDPHFGSDGAQTEYVERVARLLAESIATYFEEDRS